MDWTVAIVAASSAAVAIVTIVSNNRSSDRERKAHEDRRHQERRYALDDRKIERKTDAFLEVATAASSFEAVLSTAQSNRPRLSEYMKALDALYEYGGTLEAYGSEKVREALRRTHKEFDKFSSSESFLGLWQDELEKIGRLPEGSEKLEELRDSAEGYKHAAGSDLLTGGADGSAEALRGLVDALRNDLLND